MASRTRELLEELQTALRFVDQELGETPDPAGAPPAPAAPEIPPPPAAPAAPPAARAFERANYILDTLDADEGRPRGVPRRGPELRARLREEIQDLLDELERAHLSSDRRRSA